ncbi:hypothetical protein, partial [Pseudomonas sp. MWU13-3659]|uniref:hypothetical protein n=1 Tax=Pseudomonas sp. MWU13-3659 TaxID=2986964 RepID=UPI00207624EE
LVFSTTYKRHASIWMLSKEKTIQKLRNFLRSGGKKLRSWLQALLRMLYINVFTHLSTFECATSCAVDQKVRFPEQGQNE